MLKKTAIYFSIFCLVAFASTTALFFFYSIKLPKKEPFKKDLIGNYSLDASGLEQNLSAIPYISLKENDLSPNKWTVRMRGSHGKTDIDSS
jgi:hypothetical protein